MASHHAVEYEYTPDTWTVPTLAEARKLQSDVEEALATLNNAAHEAQRRGLRLEFDTITRTSFSRGDDHMVTVNISVSPSYLSD